MKKTVTTILTVLFIFYSSFGIVGSAESDKSSIDINGNQIKYITNDGKICVYEWQHRIKAEHAPLIDNVYYQDVNFLSESSGNLEYFVKNDGTLWQYNLNGNMNNSIQIKEINHCIKICASSGHTLALTDNGLVYAWGKNESGQLGNGNFQSSDKPQIIQGLYNITDISVGNSFSMALDSEGNVYTWGSNYRGELGNGSYTALNGENSSEDNNSNIPIKVEIPVKCAQITSGHNFAGVLTENGDVYVWGSQGSLNPKANILTPELLKNIKNCVQISANDLHLLALSASGEVWQWGNVNNALDGIVNDPIQTVPLRNISKVVAGTRDLFVISDNELWLGCCDKEGVNNMSAYCMADINSTPSSLKDILVNIKILNKNGFSSENTVSREECITAIMRVIGVTDEMIKEFQLEEPCAFADADVYTYMGYARTGKIAYGEECIIDAQNNEDCFFFPQRAVTVKEVLAFMNRCLDDEQEADFNSTLDVAIRHGLLSAEEELMQNPNDYINPDDFCLLLSRMLKQKRYKYYAEENNIMKCFIDDLYSDRYYSISYQEMLTV